MARMGTVIGMALVVELIPLAILVSALLDRSLRRRAPFGRRLATFTVIQMTPPVVLIAGAAFRVLGEDAVGELLVICVFSVFVSPALMPLLLFDRPDRSGPFGENDDGEDGPGPDRDPPLAPRPIGGLPLPDAEPSPVRARGPLPLGRFRRPRRPAREPDRTPSRLLWSALLRRWLWRPSGGV